MAGLKRSANRDRRDPGDLDAAKSMATPVTASLTQELFGHDYPSAPEYVTRQIQPRKQARPENQVAHPPPPHSLQDTNEFASLIRARPCKVAPSGAS